MGLLNPVLGNTRQEVLTPEEQATGFKANPSILGQNYDIDREDFKGINLDLAISGGLEALQESRARSQTGLQLFGKGVGNVVGTALFEISKLPGYAGGGVKAALTGDIEDMINGTYLQGVKAVQDATQEKWFEVYTPKAVSEGNLATQLSCNRPWPDSPVSSLHARTPSRPWRQRRSRRARGAWTSSAASCRGSTSTRGAS